MTEAFVAKYRSRFPIFSERLYLATQSLGPVLAETYDDVREYVSTFGLRSRALPALVGRFEEAIVLCEQLLRAPSGSVAIKDSATSCHAAFAETLKPTGRRRKIIISSDDFHSTRYLWTAQSARRFEIVDVAPKNPGEVVTAADILAHVDDTVVAVAVSLVSPRTGALLDAAALATAAHAAGAVLVLDAYQAVGVVPVHVQTLAADVVVGGTHKWLSGAGTGLAFMYVNPVLSEQYTPIYPGWIGGAHFTSFSATYVPAHGARRFMQGTPAFEPLYSSRAGLRYVLEAGIEDIRARSLELTGLLMELCSDLPIRTPRAAAARGGTIVIDAPGDMPTVVERLSSKGIDIDFRPGAGLRMSPHPVMTNDEVKRFAMELHALL